MRVFLNIEKCALQHNSRLREGGPGCVSVWLELEFASATASHRTSFFLLLKEHPFHNSPIQHLLLLLFQRASFPSLYASELSCSPDFMRLCQLENIALGSLFFRHVLFWEEMKNSTWHLSPHFISRFVLCHHRCQPNFLCIRQKVQWIRSPYCLFRTLL